MRTRTLYQFTPSCLLCAQKMTIRRRWKRCFLEDFFEKMSDELPLCRYGLDCYRRNPLHFAQFRHPDGHLIAQQMSHTDSSREDNQKKTLQTHSKLDDDQKLSDDEHPPTKKKRADSDDDGKGASSSHSNCSPYQRGNCFDFFLSSVRGLETKWNENALTKSLKDILAQDAEDFQSSVQFNYMFDLPWLLENYPASNRRRPLLVITHPTYFHPCKIYAEHANENDGTSITVAQARLPIAYGTHHTKMMMLKYKAGIRIVVHTANMIPEDWDQKTQGIYITPLLPKQSSSTSAGSDFQTDLIDYLNSYKLPALDQVVKELSECDMSSVKVKLVASIPGRFQGTEMEKWGHRKLRGLLKKHVPAESVDSNGTLVAQFSSIGSLGATGDQWLMGEFKTSLSSVRGREKGDTPLNLVFPTVENVRTSLEGYAAGGSLPYQNANASRQAYLKQYLHQWRSDLRGRTRASPHIKTYFLVSSCLKKLGWFLLTSANLSKAAWGASEKNGTQLMIRSYELGVLFLPEVYGKDHFVLTQGTGTTDVGNEELYFPLPYDLPLTPYGKEDEPWVTDRSYKDKRDSRGRFWR